MAIDKENASVWATAWEMAAFSFRYPNRETAEAVVSGEWTAAAVEIVEALGGKLPEGFGQLPVMEEAQDAPQESDAIVDTFLHTIRAEATRLFVGAPTPARSPYEGVWRAADDGVQPLLFVNPHSMEVERFCKACGLGRPEGTNEPLDHVATECELMQFLAALAAGAALPEESGITVDQLPDGSPEAAYDQFLISHVDIWMPRFADKVMEEARVPFYGAAAEYLKVILSLAK